MTNVLPSPSDTAVSVLTSAVASAPPSYDVTSLLSLMGEAYLSAGHVTQAEEVGDSASLCGYFLLTTFGICEMENADCDKISRVPFVE